MIVSENEALARLESPLNLINRLVARQTSQHNSMKLFGVTSQQDGKTNGNKSKIAVPPAPVQQESDFNPFRQAVTAELVKHIETSNEISNKPEVLPPETNLDSLIENSDSKIKLSIAHDVALDTLVKSLQMINGKLEEIPAKQLIGAATAASKIVNDIRTEQNKAGGSKSVHLHFYSPIQKQVSDYEEVTV